MPSLALVGYTNAGKSTLFSALDTCAARTLPTNCSPPSIRPCGASFCPVAGGGDRRHGWLYPRAAARPGRGLPIHPAEARAPTLLLHVVDASNARRAEQIAQVDSVLEQIGAAQIPQLIVYNKIDRLEIAPRIERDAEGRAQAAWVCAQRAEGLELR